jgi:hypothetical protein
MCINYDDETLYWSAPTEKALYRNRYSEGRRKDNANNYGTIEKIFSKRKETTWVTALDCNRNSDGLYWFNAKDMNSTDQTTLYLGGFGGDGDPEIIKDRIKEPRRLICDDED